MMNQSVNPNIPAHEDHTGRQDHDDPDTRIKVPAEFQEQLKDVFHHYILVKDALVDDNSSKAKSGSKKLSSSLDKMDMKLLQGQAHHHWMEMEAQLKSSAAHISQTDDIEIQRRQFYLLSNTLIQALKLFGINSKVYVEYCPMANSDQGAYWMSREKQIRNPYYGDAMLKCGEVRFEIE